jgi:putative OPT family oligopeptide transporter
MIAPMIPAPKEFTLRGVLLAAVLTALFTAANVYAGLKVGLTFATSIPAAVISMAALRGFANSTIQENNIVQTIASAAGTLSAIVFVLPGLLMMGWWTGFPYWQSVAVIGLGGILGVLYSVPLRRALVTTGNLPYPEGVAAAQVLQVGAGGAENQRSLRALVAGSIGGLAYPALAKLKLVEESAQTTLKLGAGATKISGGLSLMLIGVGHLVGITVGLAMLLGILISFAGLLPMLSTNGPPPGTQWSDFLSTLFRQKVRFAGAGAIGIAALWTLFKVITPVLRGIAQALAADRQRRNGQSASLDLSERDLPITIVGGAILASSVPILYLLWDFSGALGWPTLFAALAYILVAGVLIAAVTGYMAGLIGASNSPVSGLGILSVLGIALILVALHGKIAPGTDSRSLVAFALFVTAMLFGIATVANDNLQDLKTGQLVGATPWKQQLALVLGVLFGAATIPPVLNLLNAQIGFVGAPGAGPNALAAPQASLITSIAQGVLTGQLEWGLIGLGAALGAAIIATDETLQRLGKGSLPPLAVGLGMYLPMDVSSTVVVGAIIGWAYNRWATRQTDPERAERLGVLVATGLIVGDSLLSVAYSAYLAICGGQDIVTLPFTIPYPMALSLTLFSAITAIVYARARKSATD